MASILQFPDRGSAESLTLGITPQGQLIQATQEELCSGTYIDGLQGMGKTSMLESFIYQQMELGESIIVFDPKGGDLIRNVIARMPAHKLSKTLRLDLTDEEYPFNFDPFSCQDVNSEKSRRIVSNSVERAFEKLWPGTEKGVYIGDLLPPLIDTLIECPELTLVSVPRFLQDGAFRRQYVAKLQNRDTAYFWRQEYDQAQKTQLAPLLRRVRRLLKDGVVKRILCQRGEGSSRKVDFARAIGKGDIILINLPLEVPGYEYASLIIGTLLLSAIYEATFSFADLPEPKRPGFTLIVDEFDYLSTSDYERFFTKARAFKVKQFLAHQYRQQLDRTAGTTTRDATLTAHTVIAFRTNLKDSRELADKFKGIQRKPTDIHIDVLDRLENHSNPLVKEFYWHIVRHLQAAAKMKIILEKDRYARAMEVLPQFDFGFGDVAFEPEKVTLVLESLHDLLYFSQKERAIDEAQKQAFIKAYGNICGVVCTSGLTDEMAIQEMIRNLADKYARLQAELKVLLKKWSEPFDRHFAEYEAMKRARPKRERECKMRFEEAIARNEKEEKIIIREMENRLIQLKRELEELYQKHFSQREREILNFGDSELENRLSKARKQSIILLDGHVYYTTPSKEDYRIEELVREYQKHIRSVHHLDSFWEKLSNPELKLARDNNLWNEYIRLANLRRSLNLIRRQRDIDVLDTTLADRKQDHKELDRKNQQATEEHNRVLEEIEVSIQIKMCSLEFSEEHNRLSKKKEEMENEERQIEETITLLQKEQKFVERINQLLMPVIEALIKEPLAKDKAEVDAGEVLINLQKRHALVNVGGRVLEMVTIDLDHKDYKYKRVSPSEFNRREQSIREQTRAKYCRPRSQVENDLYRLFAQDSERETPPASDTEPKREQPTTGEEKEKKERDTGRQDTDDNDEYKEWYED